MKQYGIAVVGCGLIANNWLDYTVTRKDAQIKALVDIREENARNTAARYGLDASVYNNLDDALAAGGINLVYDLTFVTTHKDIVIKALRSGCDVFGEKPMAETPEQANEMALAANETGKRYFVMQNRRYVKHIRALRELIRSNALGEPGYLCADIFVHADLGSIRAKLPYPHLQDNDIHVFDQARFILGANPVSAYCQSFNPAGSKYAGDAAAACIFEFDNGVVFSFRGYNGAEGFKTTWESSWRVCCSNGTALWNGADAPAYEVLADVSEANKWDARYDKGEATTAWNGKPHHDGALEEMFEALSAGRRSETDCMDNLHSIAMVFASLKSAKEGRKIPIRISDEYPYIRLD